VHSWYLQSFLAIGNLGLFRIVIAAGELCPPRIGTLRNCDALHSRCSDQATVWTGSGVLIPAVAKYSLFQNIQTGSGAPPSLLLNGYRGSFPFAKADGTSVWSRGLLINGAIPVLPSYFFVAQTGRAFTSTFCGAAQGLVLWRGVAQWVPVLCRRRAAAQSSPSDCVCRNVLRSHDESTPLNHKIVHYIHTQARWRKEWTHATPSAQRLSVPVAAAFILAIVPPLPC
jgi:hypothetical protein